MGMNVSTIRLDPKLVKTETQVRTFFKNAVEHARIEYGEDCYSGEWNTLHRLVFTGRQFESRDAADEELSERVQKGEALVAQIKHFEEGKRIQTALQAQRVTAEEAYQAKRQQLSDKEIKAAQKAYEKSVKKVKDLRAAAAARSNKYAWVICAGCAE